MIFLIYLGLSVVPIASFIPSGHCLDQSDRSVPNDAASFMNLSSFISCWDDDRSCFCDAQCHLWGDCCQTVLEDRTEVPGSSPQHYGCVNTARTFADDVELEKYGQWFQAISTCPKGSSDDLIEHCERAMIRKMPFLDVPKRGYSKRVGEENELISIRLSSSSFRIRKADVRSMSPVVAYRTGLVYANMDCAYCNGEALNPAENETHGVLQNFRSFPTQIRCRTYSFGDRLCYATSRLPPAFRRPCTNTTSHLLESSRQQPVFSLTTFKWHEFLVLPDFTLNEGDRQSNPDYLATDLDPKTELILDISQLVLCVLSALGLLLLTLTYSLTVELRTHASGQLTIGLSVALFGLLGNFLCTLLLPRLLQTGPATDRINHGVCMSFAFLMHYFFLASFLWMAAFGVALLRTFGGCRATFSLIKGAVLAGCCFCCKRNSDDSRSTVLRETILKHPRTQASKGCISFFRRAMVPIFLPLVLVIPATVINEVYFMDECNQSESAGENMPPACLSLWRALTPGFCPLSDPTRVWFTARTGALVWFLVPTMLLLAFNCLISATVGVHIWQMSKAPQLQGTRPTAEELSTRSNSTRGMTSDTRRKKLVTFTRICAHLSIILGAVWLVQLMVNVIPGVPILYYVTGLLSTGQGLLVALLSFSNPKAKRQLRKITSTQSTRLSSSRETRSSQLRPNQASI